MRIHIFAGNIVMTSAPEKIAPSGATIVYRKESISMLVEILATGKIIGALDAMIRSGIALGLERGIYNRAIDLEEKNNVVASWIIPSFILTYKMTRHMLCEKIAAIGSEVNLERILLDPKRWETLAATPIYELRPEIFAKNIRKITDRKHVAIKVKYTDIKCENCGKFMVRNDSVQCRSADESSTPFQICDGCNTVVKGSS